jgi:hypothetical protein
VSKDVRTTSTLEGTSWTSKHSTWKLNAQNTYHSLFARTVGKNNWEAIEEGMITWDVNSASNDPANDLADVDLNSPVPSSPELLQRRHASGRHRSGRYQHPEEYSGRRHGHPSYAESSVAQPPPGTGRSSQQHGGFSNERSGGHLSGQQQQYLAQQNGSWQQANHDSGFNMPTLPYASVSGGGQISYGTAGTAHQQYQQGPTGIPQNDNQNQQAYPNLDASAGTNGSHSENDANNGELSATSIHEMNEQNMGMMHGGIDMDFQMANPSTQPAASAS